MRVLNVYYFPTGGRKTQVGIVPPYYYTRSKSCPTIVHCTGRTGLKLKLDCINEAKRLYSTCHANAENVMQFAKSDSNGSLNTADLRGD